MKHCVAWAARGRLSRVNWPTVFSFAGGFILWELIGRYVVTDPLLFAPLSKVLATGMHMLFEDRLLYHIAVSIEEFLFGFGLSAAAGIAIGMSMAIFRPVRAALDPWVAFFYSSPLVAMMPFFILVFGIGLASKIAIVFTVAIFPILLNTVTGLGAVDRHFVEVARAFDCNRGQLLFKVLLPAAQPYILVGLRLGLGRALTGVVVGELFSSQAGLGNIIATAGQSFDTATLLMGVLVFSLIGVVLTKAIDILERQLAPWRFLHPDGQP